MWSYMENIGIGREKKVDYREVSTISKFLIEQLLCMYKHRDFAGDREKVDYIEEFLIKKVTISKFHCS